MICFLLDQARRFLGLPDLVSEVGFADALRLFCRAFADSWLWMVALKLLMADICACCCW